MAGRSGPRCGARTRRGTSCVAKAIDGPGRCRHHGGLSTGAKTEAGMQRIIDAQRRRWAAWRAAKFSHVR